MSDHERKDERLHGEEAIIRLLAPLARGAPGAFGLEDDCAVITPAPGTELVLKTDPVAEGVHFLADDAPEDIAWKALAVNVSDLAAKAARPLGYLMALSFPEAPATSWLERFAAGRRDDADDLGHVERGTAADADDAIGAVSAVRIGTGHRLARSRVAEDAGVHGGRQAGGSEARHQVGE